MATVKLKFSNPRGNATTGTVYYQIIHKRQCRRASLSPKLTTRQWADIDTDTSLVHIRNRIECDMNRLRRIIRYYDLRGSEYTADCIIRSFKAPEESLSFVSYTRSTIRQLQDAGKARRAEICITSLNCLMRFTGGDDVMFSDVDSLFMLAFEGYLIKQGLSKNTTSFYMRCLRSLYNSAVAMNYAEDNHPFRLVYTGVARTVKRAVMPRIINTLRLLDLTAEPALAFARDIFIFSFLTRGMSFVDICLLKKGNIRNGFLTYCRQKTGRRIIIRWECWMQEIVNRHTDPMSPYLLPLLRPNEEHIRTRYRNVSTAINKRLKELGCRLNLPVKLTMYVSRHSWASAALRNKVPLSVISEALGHDSEHTTRIYLDSLDSVAVDSANRMVVEKMMGSTKHL